MGIGPNKEKEESSTVYEPSWLLPVYTHLHPHPYRPPSSLEEREKKKRILYGGGTWDCVKIMLIKIDVYEGRAQSRPSRPPVFSNIAHVLRRYYDSEHDDPNNEDRNEEGEDRSSSNNNNDNNNNNNNNNEKNGANNQNAGV